ncbi:TPA: hypothetical protein ACH3X2_003322 [Trebouxia sp. C0005]
MGGSQMRSSRLGATQAGVGTNDHRVFDEEGKERTPKPMLSLRPNNMRPLPSLIGESQASVTSDTDRGSMMSEMGHLERLSSAAFSTGSSRMSAGYGSSTLTPELSMGSQMGISVSAMAAGLEHKVSKQLSSSAAVLKAGPPPIEKPAVLTAAELEKPVCIRLEEIETIWLLHLPGGCINADTDEGKAVETANSKYKDLLSQREGSDRFVDAEAQTVEHLQKAKEVQCTKSSATSTEVQAFTWDINDSMYSDELTGEAADPLAPVPKAPVQRSNSEMSDQMQHLSGNEGRRASVMSAQVSLPDDPGSNRASLMGSGGGSVANWGAADSMRGSMEGSRSSMSSHMPSGMTGLPSVLQGEGMYSGGTRSSEDVVPVPIDPIGKLPGLLDALKLMDAAVQQNMYHEKLLMYRNVRMSDQDKAVTAEPAAANDHGTEETSPTPEAEGNEGVGPGQQDEYGSNDMGEQAGMALTGRDPRLTLLWEWQCPLPPSLTLSTRVTCMAWNKASLACLYCPSGIAPSALEAIQDMVHSSCEVRVPGVRQDILAVGYGQFEFGPPLSGLVALWSLKNPGYPLWSFPTPSGVTAVDFSVHNPNMLAVGLYDGTLAVHDVKTRQEVPSLSSSAGSGQHSDPVWQVSWVDRGLEQEERLVTISTDGRVTQWATTKALEHTDLIKLKRTVSKQKVSPAAAAAMRNVKGEAFISRRSSGMSFDFSHRDERMYIAGTEDGHIYKCSTSYSEQYLETYSGHLGPVYRVQWSPFQSNLFISSSADWSVKLWTEGKEHALLTFQSANDEVNDVQWCPTNSTVFGTATSGGRIEIWDLAASTLKPIAQHTCEGRMFSSMLFSEESPVVVAGGSNGGVQVLRLLDVDLAGDLEAVQTRRLDDAMRANIVKTGVVNVQ